MAIRRRWKAAAVATAGLLAATGCAGGSTRRATPTTTTIASTSSSTTVPGAAGPYTWAEVSSPALTLGGGPTAQLGGVAAPAGVPGEQWLVAGTVTTADGHRQATVWTSPDGVTWHAQALNAQGKPSQASGVTYWGNRAVIVGAIGSETSERAAVWLSPSPGAPFHLVGAAAVFGDPAGAAMSLVAGGTLGLFAAGTAGTQQVLWYSSDGTHWTRQTRAEDLLADEPGARVAALLVAPQGVFAAGWRRAGSLEEAAMWMSANASTWRDVSAPQSFAGAGDREIRGLATLAAPGAAAQGTELVAVGGVRSGSTWAPASWMSPDGSSWSEPSLAFPQESRPLGNAGGAEAEAVASSGTQLVAVGGGAAQRLWISADGRSWAEAALPTAAADAAAWQASLVATEGGTTVVGDGAFGQPHLLTETPAGWQEPSADPAVFGAELAVANPAALVNAGGQLVLAVDVVTPGGKLGDASSTVAFFSSPDGQAWHALPESPAFTDAVVRGVLGPAGSGGRQSGPLVAVGGQPAGSLAAASGLPGAAAWVSTDGETWRAAEGGPSVFFGGDEAARADAVTRFGSRYIAVGQGPSGGGIRGGAAGNASALAWTSVHGSAWQVAGPLDPHPGAGSDAASGVCARGDQAVAVGETDQVHSGQQARAWSSHDGIHWVPAAIAPPAATGADEQMVGCLPTPTTAAREQSTWVAYGQSTDANGAITAALWASGDGLQWTRTPLPSVPGVGRVTDVAMVGTKWIAVGSPPSVTGMLQSASNVIGLWTSEDAGRTWRPLDTSLSPWPGAATSASANVGGFVGNDAVVAGQVNGHLAVWIGTPTR